MLSLSHRDSILCNIIITYVINCEMVKNEPPLTGHPSRTPPRSDREESRSRTSVQKQ